MIRRHRFLLGSSSLLALAGLMLGCANNSPPVTITPPPVSVSQPVVRDVIYEDDYEGKIEAAKKVDIRAKVKGHIIKVNFQAGQLVKGPGPAQEPGDLLYEIDPRQYQHALEAVEAQVKAGEAALHYATAEYLRVKSLVPSRAASQEELEVWAGKQAVAKGEVLKAKAAVKQAQDDLDHSRITAPFAGKISRTQVEVGTLVNAGGGETLLTTLVSLTPLYVTFNVDERSLLRYRRSRKEPANGEKEVPIADLKIPVYVGLEGEDGFPHKGFIDFADNKVNPSTGTILVRGEMTNPSPLLQDGLRARVRVPIGSVTRSILVTERAVGNEQGRKFVYTVDDQNIVQRRDVTVGRVLDGLVEILSGLKQDEWVIVNGIQRVREEMEVKPKQGPMPGAKPTDIATQKPSGK